MVDELNTVENIDKQLQLDGICRDTSVGLICMASILGGLGFSQRILYTVSTVFDDKPMHIHAYGCTEPCAHLAPETCKILGLGSKNWTGEQHRFSFGWVYNSRGAEVDSKVLHLKKGHSRNHRPDLNLVEFNLIVKYRAGIPLHIQALNGKIKVCFGILNN